jgi:hypothetical protein
MITLTRRRCTQQHVDCADLAFDCVRSRMLMAYPKQTHISPCTCTRAARLPSPSHRLPIEIEFSGARSKRCCHPNAVHCVAVHVRVKRWANSQIVHERTTERIDGLPLHRVWA